MKQAIGTCYYPEHWPEEIWADDAARMAEAGILWVRIGEFAWSRMEPKPGQMEWGWLDKAIEILGAAGRKVVLCTPTATPPRWMVEKWPDMLAHDAEGRARKFGSRRHYCFSHLGYREESARITELMAERYGKNPIVAAWQTDNEFGCHDTTLSYSPAALAGFRDWLAQKYQSPQALNAAWGNVFWSMEYEGFDEIELPTQTVTEPNPTHVLDFARYSSDQVVAFNRTQTDVLRRHTGAPIIHNFMGRMLDFDHFKVGENLDIASWDAYPLGFLEVQPENTDKWKKKFLRQGDPDFQAFHHDLYRAVGRGRWWVMEQQPGPVNWAPYNPAPLPGMVRLWAWEAFAHGAETVSYFRWRQAPFAQEQMHTGLLRSDGVAAPGLAEAAQVASELAEFGDLEPANVPVALVYDYQSAWAWRAQPQGADFDYFALVFAHYRVLRKLGLSVDIISPESALEGYKVVVAPGLMHLNETFRASLKKFRGTLVAGPRTGSKTPDMQIPAKLPPDIPGLECTVELVETLRPGVKRPLNEGGAFITWVETLSGKGLVLETKSDGTPAIMAGEKNIYVGGWLNEEALTRLLKKVCLAESVEICETRAGVRMRDTKTHRFYFNYSTAMALVGKVELAPGGVYWEKLD